MVHPALTAQSQLTRMIVSSLCQAWQAPPATPSPGGGSTHAPHPYALLERAHSASGTSVLEPYALPPCMGGRSESGAF